MGVVLWIAMLVACGGTERGVPDADLTPSPHDQWTTCDPLWSADRRPPPLCDHACADRPVDKPCSTLDKVCYDQPGCALATSPSAPPVECATTFIVAGTSITGCCKMRTVQGTMPVPTFYECSRR